MAGYFISLEGIDGCGKTTLAKNLAAALSEQGHDVLMCHDMRATPQSDELRRLLTSGDDDKWTPTTELYLYNAGRHETVERVIRPALKQGKFVICDRYADSTMAYQGYGRGLPQATIHTLNGITVADCMPNITFVMDIDPAVSLDRVYGRPEGASRIESNALEFHTKVAEGFRQIVRQNHERCVFLDAAQPQAVILKRALGVLASRNHAIKVPA